MENSNQLILKEKTTKENRIWVRISSACNIKCVFCLDESAQDGTLVPEEKVKKQIKDSYKEWYYNRVIISGGEASINPKFPEYIRYAKEVWYDRVQTVTNGNMFAIPKFCDKVFDAGLEEVTFSFHGHTPRLHDYLVDVPGAFKKALTWLIYVKKNYPDVIVNIDIVVNKVNVSFLPDIVKFFMKIWVYEYDILHIIPFWRGFDKYKDILFYKVEDYLEPLHETWKLSRIPGMYMWTNRFPVEAFEWFEDLIQDPRKIKSETMWEWYDMYGGFIASSWKTKPSCFWEACNHCFLNQYCHDFLSNTQKNIDDSQREIIENNSISSYAENKKKFIVLRWESFPSEVYEKFWEKWYMFVNYIRNLELWEKQELINVPRCVREENNSGKYEYYPDIKENTNNIEEYTQNYIQNFYRKKSTRCKTCVHNDTCEWIHINFIRSYGFKILNPVSKTKK